MDIRKETKYLKDLTFEDFKCEHQPFPIIRGLPLVCDCWEDHLEHRFDILFDFLSEKFNKKNDKGILLWLKNHTGWYHLEYKPRDLDARRSTLIGIKLVRGELYGRNLKGNRV